MRAQKTKKEKRQSLLINKLKEKKTLSISEISELLSCSRASVYNYLSRLEECGCSLHKELRDNNIFYSLKESASDQGQYMPITADTLRKYIILQVLQETPVPKDELRKKFTLSSKTQLPDYADKILIDIKTTRFYQLVKELLSEGEIELNPSDQKYYLTGNTVPLILPIDNMDKMLTLYDELSNVSPGNPYYSQLRSIYQKIGLLLNNIEPDISFIQNYLVYGKKFEAFNKMSSLLKQLNHFDYKHKILEIDYLSKKGNLCTDFIATGMIIYCEEKDTIYLLGEKQSKKSSSPYIIDLSTIRAIRETAEIHSCYHSNFFQTAFQEMFSISLEKPVKVVVEFDRVANIERKITYLSKQRKFSQLTIQNNTIRYIDTIRGIADFANYLRQFGKNAHVKEPDVLIRQMNFSVKRALKRYEETSHE